MNNLLEDLEKRRSYNRTIRVLTNLSTDAALDLPSRAADTQRNAPESARVR